MTQPPAKPDEPRPNRVPWPPLLEAATLVMAIGLQRTWPLPELLPAGPLRWSAWLIVAGGLAIAASGILHFRRIGTTVDPTGRAVVLATDGIYAWTRNPMYTGALLVFAGLGLAWPLTWLLVLLPVLALGLFKLAIAREEVFLEQRFVDAYRAYKSRVRRWL